MKRLHSIMVGLVVFMLASVGSAFAAHDYGKGQVNVNTATRDQLVWFLGESKIGDAEMIADNILAYREANGPFDKVDDLRNVRGIDQAVLDRIKFRVKVAGPTDYDPEAVVPSPGLTKGGRDSHESS